MKCVFILFYFTFFFARTQLWNSAKFLYAYSAYGRHTGEHTNVYNIDGLPLATCSCRQRCRHFLRLKSLHVQFSTDMYTAYTIYECCFSWLFFLFIRLLFYVRAMQIPSIALYADFAYDSECFATASRINSRSEHISQEAAGRGGGWGQSSKIFAQANAMVANNFPSSASCCLFLLLLLLLTLLFMKLCALIPHVTATQARDRA